MKKILINRNIVQGPWGGGNNFVKSLYEELQIKGYSLVHTLKEDIDLIIMIDPRYDESRISINEISSYKRNHPKVKILHRINECDARKNTNDIDRLLLVSNQIADETVFISQWLRDYFIEKGFNKRSHVIYNGCNSSHFYPKKNLENKKVKTPIKIVTHHWSDNWMKGFDAYKYLDKLCEAQPEKYQFTYVGRYSKEYSPKFTNLINPLHGKELGDELRKHDVYVTASRFEPCGMHHIEGASSGLPVIYHKDGGGIVEGCLSHGVSFSSINELDEKLNYVISNHDDMISKIDYKFLSSDRCLSDYLELINSMF
jgi:hypothetical protein